MQTECKPPELIQTHPRTLNIAILPRGALLRRRRLRQCSYVKIFPNTSLLLVYTPGPKQAI